MRYFKVDVRKEITGFYVHNADAFVGRSGEEECHIFPKGGHGAPWCDSTIWEKTAR